MKGERQIRYRRILRQGKPPPVVQTDPLFYWALGLTLAAFALLLLHIFNQANP